MTKITLSVFIFFVILNFCSSCVVEKRVYNSGFHVYSKKHSTLSKHPQNTHGTLSIVSEVEKPSINKQPTSANNNINSELIPPSETYSHTQSATSKLPSNKNNPADQYEFANHFRQVNKNHRSNKTHTYTTSPRPNWDDRITNKLGLASLITSFFILFGSIPAVIFGAIALRQFKKEPEKYKHILMPKIGLAIGYTGCAFGVLYTLAGFLWTGSFIYLLFIILFLVAIILSLNILLTDRKLYDK